VRGAETLPRTEIVGAGSAAAVAASSETRRLEVGRAPTSGPGRSATAEERACAGSAAAVAALTGPAQQGKEGRGGGRAGQKEKRAKSEGGERIRIPFYLLN
jgi:hypothetical protein